MTSKIDLRLEDEMVGPSAWRWLRLAVVLSALVFVIVFNHGAIAEIKSEPTPGPSDTVAPSNPSVPGGSGPQTNQGSRLKKVAPESVVVQMNNGVGQATVVYYRKAGEAAPSLDWTEAIGSANSIAKDKITVKWVGQPQTVGQYELATLSINVATSDWVEPNVTYKVTIIFIWPDAPAPQTETFTITNAVVADFKISRTKIDAVLMSGQPTSADFIVSNSGKEKITKLTFSSTDLEDSATHRRAEFGAAQSSTITLEPGREQSVAVTLPRPSYAGTYIGTLNVIANERVRQSIPLSVITRGPTLGRWNWLPCVLFFLTLTFGYLLSLYLEQWFGLGGLERAQALVTLERACADIVKTLEKMRAWEKAHPEIELDAAKVRLDGDRRELSEILEHPNKLSNDVLKANLPRFTTVAASGTILYLKVETATLQWHFQKLKPVIDALDAVPFPAAADGVDKYRAALDKVLADHVNSQTPLPQGAPMPSSDRLSERVSAEQLEIKIERMNLLKRFAVAGVVFIMGYMTLYWKDPDFGTLPDYFAVFLWAFGLSTTGAGILTSAKSSFTRPT
ncbi:MAG TPA: hypothetical protein VJU86_16970 [Pyrinomonadaceae bacterium]|nr:hypothetical protein [Pyrinomonadaceae bacterium]